MTEPLYGMPVLRLAAAIADYPPLADADAMAEKRSPICGSRVIVSLRRDAAGRIAALGIEAHACALGQAAATLLARAAPGRSAEEISIAAQEWAAWLAGESDTLPNWPGIDQLAAGRDYPARHASLRLAFEAAAEALASPTSDACQQASARTGR